MSRYDPFTYANAKLHIMRRRPFESLGCARKLHPRDQQARRDFANHTRSDTLSYAIRESDD